MRFPVIFLIVGAVNLCEGFLIVMHALTLYAGNEPKKAFRGQRCLRCRLTLQQTNEIDAKLGIATKNI